MANPSLYEDLRAQELLELVKIVHLPVISHIEGYDISNIQGSSATGSMVTFTNGEADKALYRRFKINQKNTPDDTGMMQEMISRRLTHHNWIYPDLMMVDGGKGQVSAALNAFEKSGQSIPVIGLAKQFEEIIMPDKNGSFTTVRLKKSSRALQLLQRIRNEAHRFANAYHRKLRNTATITS